MNLRMGQRKKEDVTGDNVSQDVGGADCVELKGEGKESRLYVESASQQIHVLCMCMYACVGVRSYGVTEEEKTAESLVLWRSKKVVIVGR